MRYLIAVDGSDTAFGAVEFLNRLAPANGDEVDIVHVLQEPWGVPKSFKEYERIRRVQDVLAEKILLEAEDALSLPDGVTVRSLTLEGEPEGVLIERVRRMDVDLLILGASGLSAGPVTKLGSVARKVVIGAPVPVLVIRSRVEGNPGDPLKVVLGTDGSECSSKAVAALTAIPFPKGSKIQVLHAVESPLRVLPERFSLELDDGLKEAIAEARRLEIAAAERLVAHDAETLGTAFSQVATKIPMGEPTWEIIRAAEEWGAELVAVGCRGSTSRQSGLGSVARRILSKAPCSVLVSKMPG